MTHESMTPRPRQSKLGFTLIEMMIAMTILSFIALGVYETTAQSFTLRENIEQDGDFYNSIRVALDSVGRDIVHIYSPQGKALPGVLSQGTAPNPAATPGAQGPGFAPPAQQTTFGNPAQQNPMGSLAPGNKFWGDPLNENGVRRSRFQGEGEKISFITNNHMRLYRDTPDHDFAKIEYQLGEEKLPPPGHVGKALVRHEDSLAFDDKDQSESTVTYTLLTNIKSLDFKFLDGEKDSWESRWDSNGIDHKDVYPAIIKLTVEVYMPNSKENTIKVEQLYRPELSI